MQKVLAKRKPSAKLRMDVLGGIESNNHDISGEVTINNSNTNSPNIKKPKKKSEKSSKSNAQKKIGIPVPLTA